MPKICYVNKRFGQTALDKIELINAILDDYTLQGYDLTLRQLYYQMVKANLIPNNLREYKNLGVLVSDARLAGLIDWDYIVDRVRNLEKRSAWNSPGHIISSAAASYHIDYWAEQDYRVEVWVEKNALIGVVGPICNRLDVPYFACIGYNSQSEAWGAAQRILGYFEEDKQVLIIHLGDHDPSGKDMTRDIEARFRLFLEKDLEDARIGVKKLYDFEVRRIALNYDQILQYSPPPNPTKLTDSRAEGYIQEFGHECWELDALSPSVISNLIENEVESVRDEDRWEQALKKENTDLSLLQKASKHWKRVVTGLEGIP